MKAKVDFETHAMRRIQCKATSTPLETGSGSLFTPKSVAITMVMALLTSLSGCGLIFGGNQSVDNKSHDYEVVRLDRDKGSQWRRVDAEALMQKQVPEKDGATEPGPSARETGDVAFEHRKTGAIIALNSVCRDYGEKTLDELSAQLMIGVRPNTEVKKRDIVINGVPARINEFETTMAQRAPSNGSTSKNQFAPVRIRTVVFRKNECTYDIMYLADPMHFQQHTKDFDRFVRGFHAD